MTKNFLRVICGAERLLNSFNEKKKPYNYYLALRFRLYSCNKGTKLYTSKPKAMK